MLKDQAAAKPQVTLTVAMNLSSPLLLLLLTGKTEKITVNMYQSFIGTLILKDAWSSLQF